MRDLSNGLGNYQVEVSGWGQDGDFFTERADLFGSRGGEDESRKKLVLHRPLAEGAVVFVRLFSSKGSFSSLPVPYRVQCVQPMDCNGQYEIGILLIHPRLKAPIGRQVASNLVEDLVSVCKAGESAGPLEIEEILHEA